MKMRNKNKKSFPFGWFSLLSLGVTLIITFILPFFFVSFTELIESMLLIWWGLIIIFTFCTFILSILGIIKNEKVQRVVSIICLIISIFILMCVFIFFMLASNTMHF